MTEGYIDIKTEGYIDRNNDAHVTAFKSKIDTRANDSQLYFRETMDPNMLNRATRDLEDGTGFNATWVFIATWHEVTYESGDSTSPVREPMLVNTSVPHG